MKSRVFSVFKNSKEFLKRAVWISSFFLISCCIFMLPWFFYPSSNVCQKDPSYIFYSIKLSLFKETFQKPTWTTHGWKNLRGESYKLHILAQNWYRSYNVWILLKWERQWPSATRAALLSSLRLACAAKTAVSWLLPLSPSGRAPSSPLLLASRSGGHAFPHPSPPLCVSHWPSGGVHSICLHCGYGRTEAAYLVPAAIIGYMGAGMSLRQHSLLPSVLDMVFFDA